MTGPQVRGPRVPDVHILQAVSRIPAALPGGRAPAPLSLSLPPCACPLSLSHLPALESMGPTQTPGTEGQWDVSSSFQRHPAGSWPFPLRLLGVLPRQHLSSHSEGKTAEACCRRPQRVPGARSDSVPSSAWSRVTIHRAVTGSLLLRLLLPALPARSFSHPQASLPPRSTGTLPGALSELMSFPQHLAPLSPWLCSFETSLVILLAASNSFACIVFWFL